MSEDLETLNALVVAMGAKPSEGRPQNTEDVKPTKVSQLPSGTHIAVRWSPHHIFGHHGIHVGGGKVVHLGANGVQCDEIDDFVTSSYHDLFFFVYEGDDPAKRQSTKDNAMKFLGCDVEELPYHSMSRNRDGFASACRTGRWDTAVCHGLVAQREPPPPTRRAK